MCVSNKSVLIINVGFFYKLGPSSFSRLHLGMFCFGLQSQTDSERTDFACDGEMTATEVCTSKRE